MNACKKTPDVVTPPPLPPSPAPPPGYTLDIISNDVVHVVNSRSIVQPWNMETKGINHTYVRVNNYTRDSARKLEIVVWDLFSIEK